MIQISYIGVIISHYKDPYKPTSIVESNKFFFRGSGEIALLGVFFPCVSLYDAIQPVLSGLTSIRSTKGPMPRISSWPSGGSMMEEIWLTTSNVEKHIKTPCKWESDCQPQLVIAGFLNQVSFKKLKVKSPRSLVAAELFRIRTKSKLKSP